LSGAFCVEKLVDGTQTVIVPPPEQNTVGGRIRETEDSLIIGGIFAICQNI
jgi:hypothetical protein